MDSEFKKSHAKCKNITNNMSSGPRSDAITILIIFASNHIYKNSVITPKTFFSSTCKHPILVNSVQLCVKNGLSIKKSKLINITDNRTLPTKLVL